jgi:hypothetical protein
LRLACLLLLSSACVEIADLRVSGDDIEVRFQGSGSVAPCHDTTVLTWIALLRADGSDEQWTVQVPRPVGQPTWPLDPKRGIIGERATLRGPGLPASGAYATDGQLELGPGQRDLVLSGEFTTSEGELIEVRVSTRQSDHGVFTQGCP